MSVWGGGVVGCGWGGWVGGRGEGRVKSLLYKELRNTSIVFDLHPFVITKNLPSGPGTKYRD
ncbi:hypothetical protein AGMMS49942_16060 [Spirochaetia bacterium]|nr:hypothetical protein AGMMS49942_16060 [Spirochaetia bacterium]